MVPASTSLASASRGVRREVTLPRLTFHCGTAAFSFSAGLDTMNRLALFSLPARAVLSIATPPNE